MVTGVKDNGHEENEHHEIVHRLLNQRVCGIAGREMVPDEHHGGARSRGQDDATGYLLIGFTRTDESGEYEPEEEPGQKTRSRMSGAAIPAVFIIA